MKQVYITKDAYENNSLRVNYFERDSVREFKHAQWNEETEQMETIAIEEIYDNLLFCERLFWELDETELEEQIEQNRQGWVERINN